MLLAGCGQETPSVPAIIVTTPTTVAQPTEAPPSATPTPPSPSATPQATPTTTPPNSGSTSLPVEVIRGSAASPTLALTFDCGAGAGPLPSILQTLRANSAKVTFFVTGAFAEKFPDMVRQIAADGHEVSNHSYSHPNLTELSNAAIVEELTRAERILAPLIGRSSKPWMRMPFGARNPKVLEVVYQAGYSSIYWSIDSGDWQADATAGSVLNRAGNARNGDIVVEHCGAPQSAEALPAILNNLKARGLRVVTISELLGQGPTATAQDGSDLLAPVDKDRALAATYEPTDLVTITGVPTTRSGMRLRKEALNALTALWEEAKSKRLQLSVLSAYRSYQDQVAVYGELVTQMGEAEAGRVSARPGHSEHQLGTTVDFTSPGAGNDLVEAFSKTPEGAWLEENAHRYGYVMSYPQGKEAVTGYAYEPWHFRYVGTEAAAAVRRSGVTLHEYVLSR